ncbi:hypothetical protein [Sulfurospirillum deleyianum]|uniref:Uncharacterized protein n=1 Tax=Sulfurospirillum deleyianum (strain ATCC 51133 / DSM 6946 / 5175) TaxID=525898 RepID=D1B1J8_SULD5|nr:hypothetical protein [Sulfurospirillum deleyianum]ACZ11968.1 hypothetical protein Sdel_0938 [Sulfurospirillum deleyianum DSM 6946]
MKPISSKQLLHFYARMPEPLQQEVLEKTFEQYYTLKSRNTEGLNRSMLYHQALLFVLKQYNDTLTLGSAKKNSKELDSLDAKNKLQLKMFDSSQKRSAKKRSKLLDQYASLIYQLKEKEGKSYSQICLHLGKSKKFKVDTTYLCKLYPIIKQNIEDLKAMTMEKNSIL